MDLSEYERIQENKKLLEEALDREKELQKELKVLNDEKLKMLNDAQHKVVITHQTKNFKQVVNTKNLNTADLIIEATQQLFCSHKENTSISDRLITSHSSYQRNRFKEEVVEIINHPNVQKILKPLSHIGLGWLTGGENPIITFHDHEVLDVEYEKELKGLDVMKREIAAEYEEKQDAKVKERLAKAKKYLKELSDLDTELQSSKKAHENLKAKFEALEMSYDSIVDSHKNLTERYAVALDIIQGVSDEVNNSVFFCSPKKLISIFKEHDYEDLKKGSDD